MVWPLTRARSLSRTSPRPIDAWSARRSRRFRPALERLEDRVTPTLSIALQEAGVNGGAPTVVATAADFTGAIFLGTYGDFAVSFFGASSHNGLQAGTFSDLLSATTSIKNNSGGAATLNL